MCPDNAVCQPCCEQYVCKFSCAKCVFVNRRLLGLKITTLVVMEADSIAEHQQEMLGLRLTGLALGDQVG